MNENEQNNKPQPESFSIMFRILAGSYLVYNAWSLRTAASRGALYVVAMIVFGVLGLALAGYAVWELIQVQRETKKEKAEEARAREEALAAIAAEDAEDDEE